MSLSIQPPPDAPAPPPSDAALVSQNKWYWLKAAGVTSIVLLLLSVLTAPMTIRARKKTSHTEALSNVRQMGLALFQFDTEYGSFPSESTIAMVDEAAGGRSVSGLGLEMGTASSNAFFRQLFEADIASSETMFYAKGKGFTKPDNVFTGGEALKKGECGFTYFLGANPRDNPLRPLVVAPMIPGTDRFDPKPFEGRAVVLSLDQTARSYPIDKNGHVAFEGRNLMDPAHPVWDGHAPTIAWPE